MCVSAWPLGIFVFIGLVAQCLYKVDRRVPDLKPISYDAGLQLQINNQSGVTMLRRNFLWPIVGLEVFKHNFLAAIPSAETLF